MEGRDLTERLQLGPLDSADAIGLVAQVASALDAAHARGLVHRDVKPSNVLLDTGARPDGSDHVYLADFGLTRRVSEDAGVGDDGHHMGTIDYVAPEQIAGEEIDGRADVYSGTVGGQDIWVSTREDTRDPFSAPVNLGSAVNTADNETRPSLSWDAETLYFGRAPAAGGPGDIYRTTRQKVAH